MAASDPEIENLKKLLAKEVKDWSKASKEATTENLEKLQASLHLLDELRGKDSGGTSEQLAMHNHLILRCIFDHLDISSIKTARQVCKTWNENAIPILAKKSTVRFKNLEKVDQFLSEKVSHALVQNFEIKNIQTETTHDFFETYGSTVLSLNLEVTDPSELHTILFKSCSKLKQIKYLIPNYAHNDQLMENFFFNRYLNLQRIQTMLKHDHDHKILYQLLKACPNLTHLYLECGTLFQFEENYTFDFQKLKALTIKCSSTLGLGDSDIPKIQKIQQCGTYLKNLTNAVLEQVDHLEYLNLQTDVSILKKQVPILLERFKTSLESLILTDWTWNRERTEERNGEQQYEMFELPFLTKLKEFMVHSPKKLGINFGEFVHENMPNLEVLRISCGGSEIHKLLKDMRHQDLQPHQHVKSISVGNWDNGLAYVQDLKILRKMFPNVTVLEITLSFDNERKTNTDEGWLKNIIWHLADFKLKQISIGFDTRAEPRHSINFKNLNGLKHLKGLEILNIRYGRSIPKLAIAVFKEIIPEIPGLREINIIGAKYTGDLSLLSSEFLNIAKRYGVGVGFRQQKDRCGYFCGESFYVY